MCSLDIEEGSSRSLRRVLRRVEGKDKIFKQFSFLGLSSGCVSCCVGFVDVAFAGGYLRIIHSIKLELAQLTTGPGCVRSVRPHGSACSI